MYKKAKMNERRAMLDEKTIGMTPARFLMVTIILVYNIYIRDSQLNRPESVSLASLARQLWYVQILFL